MKIPLIQQVVDFTYDFSDKNHNKGLGILKRTKLEILNQDIFYLVRSRTQVCLQQNGGCFKHLL
jgi:hypothetical protein